MKSFALATLTALILSGLIFICASFINVEYAKALALLPLAGFFSHIVEAFERLDSRRSLTTNRPARIYSVDGFAISWPLLLVYGTLAIFAIITGSNTLAGAIGGGILGAAGDTEAVASKDVMSVGLTLIAFPLQLIGGYIVGRWIGTRSARNGIAVVLMSASLGTVLAALQSYLFITLRPESFKFLGEVSLAGLIEPTIEKFGTVSLSGLVGYWRGHQRKLSWYIQYLLSVLPKSSRDALIELAFEEVNSARTTVPAK